MSKLILTLMICCSFVIYSCNSGADQNEKNNRVDQLEELSEELEETKIAIDKETEELNESLDDLLKDIEE